jgi:heme a synthase
MTGFNLSPLLHMVIMAFITALLPLSWVWLRQGSAANQAAARLRALSLVTLFLTFDLVLFGAFTRLTDSGLGCPDWPGCYGHVSPLQAQAHIDAAQAALPSGPVTTTKAWIEMLHRYFAAGIGVLTLTLALFSTWLKRRQPAVNIVLPWATFAWVCVQGAFGAFTVTLKLMPLVVSLHLLGGMTLLALLLAQARSAKTLIQPAGPGSSTQASISNTNEHAQSLKYAPSLNSLDSIEIPVGLRRRLLLGALVLVMQIALGAWVSSNYAVLACTSFPSCQGSFWPEMNFAQGFELMRHLGVKADGQFLDFSALTAIHYGHRLMAYLVFALLGWVAWGLIRHARTEAQATGLRRPAKMLLHLLLWQLLTGAANVLFSWPLAAALAHTAGAAGLVLVLTHLILTTRNTTNEQS